MSTKFEIIKSRLVSLTTMAGVNIIMHVMNGGHRLLMTFALKWRKIYNVVILQLL